MFDSRSDKLKAVTLFRPRLFLSLNCRLLRTNERRSDMEQKEKSVRELQAEEQLRQAKARLNKVRNEERKKARKEQDHHKFIMGGIVAKYFPECYEFSEQEMNRILACAFKNRDILNMIGAVVKDRKTEVPETAQNEEQEDRNAEADS